MMRYSRFVLTPVALSVILTLGARELSGQARIFSLAATSPADLGLVVTSGAVQTLAGVTDNAVNNFPSPVVIQTTWSVNPGQTNTVNLVAYFAVPAQALVGLTTQIPSSRILGRMTTGIPTTFSAVTQNGIGGAGTAGGSLRLYSVVVNGGNKNSSRTDNLDLQLDLVGFPALPAGVYAGVLNLRVITQ
jgi:hypothetical protein